MVNGAIGKNSGNADIFVNRDSRYNSLVYKNEASSIETIRVDTIDDFMGRNGIKIVDFLKIDTEGCELEVIAGAESALREQNVGVLYVEAEPTPSDRHFVSFEELRLVLSSFGYELFGIYEQQPHWSGKKSILYFNPTFICQKLVEQGVTPNAYPLRG